MQTTSTHRSYLVVFTCVVFSVFSIGGVWLVQKSRSINSRNKISNQLLDYGVNTRFDHQGIVLEGIEFKGETHPNEPAWLRNVFGDDYFQVINGVKIETCDLNKVKKALPLLKKLRHLEYIILPSCGGMFNNSNDEIDVFLKRKLPHIEFYNHGVIG